MVQSPLSNIFGQLSYYLVLSGILAGFFFSWWVPIILFCAWFMILRFFNDLDQAEMSKQYQYPDIKSKRRR